MEDNTETTSAQESEPLSFGQQLKLDLFWFFYDQIQWLKVLFTFPTKEEREFWRLEMMKAGRSNRVTEPTTLGTPRFYSSNEFDMRSFFTSTFSLRAYFKDMFSGWNIGWERRAQDIYSEKV